jgi:hypothetical protein
MIHYFFETKNKIDRDGNLLIMSKQFKNYDELPVKFNEDLEQWLSIIKVYDISSGGIKKLKPTAKRFLNSDNIFKVLN